MGHLTDPEMCSLQYKIALHSHTFFVEILVYLHLYLGFTIGRVTTQHTTKCVENCSDGKVSYICLPDFYQIFCNLVYDHENSIFF